MCLAKDAKEGTEGFFSFLRALWILRETLSPQSTTFRISRDLPSYTRSECGFARFRMVGTDCRLEMFESGREFRCRGFGFILRRVNAAEHEVTVPDVTRQRVRFERFLPQFQRSFRVRFGIVEML